MKIRRLRKTDADLALNAVRTLKAVRPDGSPSGRSLRRFLSRDANILLLASDVTGPTGFLLAYALDRVDGDRAMVLLYEIVVAPSHRRHGVGTALVHALLDSCRAMDATEAWTITNRSSQAAVALFEGTGGRPPARDDVVYVWEEW